MSGRSVVDVDEKYLMQMMAEAGDISLRKTSPVREKETGKEPVIEETVNEEPREPVKPTKKKNVN